MAENKTFPTFSPVKWANVHDLTIDVSYDGIRVWVSRYRDDGQPMKEKKVFFDVRTDVYVEAPNTFVDMHGAGWYHYIEKSDGNGVFDVEIKEYLNDGSALKFYLKNFRKL